MAHPFTMLALQLLEPLCRIAARLAGLEFTLYNERVYLLLITGLNIFLCRHIEKKPGLLPCLLLFPATILVSLYYVLTMDTLLVLPLTLANCICAGWVLGRFLPNRWYKYLAQVLCSLLTIGFVWLCGFFLLLADIGSVTVVQEAQSPEGGYSAQLIDDDQGALGGNTLVLVDSTRSFPAIIGQCRPMRQEVYRGPWGAFEHMTLRWQDEHTLLINGEPYPIQ